MKRLLFSICLLATASLVLAQDCAGYYYLTENAFEMTSFDRKDKATSVVTYTVSNVSRENGDVSAEFQSEAKDSKGKVVTQGSGKYKCSGGVIYLDARVSLPSAQMEAYKDMDVTADEAYIAYPANMSEGQTLPDGSYSMTVSRNGSAFSEITYKVVNRKVEGKEKISTPAGTWDCWRIRSEGQFKATIANSGIGFPFNFATTEWFAPGFGIVKTETENKNGKMAGYTLITALKK